MKKQDLPQLHENQWKILKKLRYGSESLFKYNELRLKELDPKNFAYHLKKLQKLDLVNKDVTSGHYNLTDKGKLILNYFQEKPSLGNLPVDSFIILYITKGEKVLTVKREEAPYRGRVGTLCYKITQDKSVKSCAQEAFDSLGLIGDLKLRLILEVLYQKPVKHTFMYTFFCCDPKGEPVERTHEGKLKWMDTEKLLEVENGYDNTVDMVKFFHSMKEEEGIKVLTRSYDTKM